MARNKREQDADGFVLALKIFAVIFVLLGALKPLGGNSMLKSVPLGGIAILLIAALAVAVVGIRFLVSLSRRPLLANNQAFSAPPIENAPHQVAKTALRQWEAPAPRSISLAFAPPNPQPNAASLREQLRALDWFQFEKVMELLFRNQGHVVRRLGGARPDGGLDLVLGHSPDGVGVQCKHWQNRDVGVRHVRELLGALQDAGLKRGILVGLNGFTADARALANRHSIQLLGESGLLEPLVRAGALANPAFRSFFDSKEKFCPRCEEKMVLRTPRKGGAQFWGCSAYPRCRSTLAA